MKTAFAAWKNRIAPVFDVTRQIHIVETESGQIVREVLTNLTDDIPPLKARRLVELGIEKLVCGAISCPLQTMIESYGIRVTPFITGELREVIEAWLSSTLENGLFAMPGCCGRGIRRFRGTHGFEQEERSMDMKGRNRNKSMKAVQGESESPGAQNQNRTRQRKGRMGGYSSGGPGGHCICPQCGHREAHERGLPCTQKQCPNCRVPMRRE
jgi:predicted Fe-Mo cluster-binding NifX family protein